ncbi:MAG: FliA/WhiG family RNA polymerase sigma factor [Clostridia bacterium]|nr:FliA/WhiG family RNA polymerase sigma factor [Clostridia bacterium]
MNAQNREMLWQSYLQGDQEAYSLLVESYLPLVKYIVGRLDFKLPNHMGQEDLVSHGVFGLMDAMERYDPGRGAKFETYASLRIRGAVVDALRQEQWAPRSVMDRLKDYQGIVKDLEDRGQAHVSQKEIAEKMGLSLQQFSSFLAEINRISKSSLEEFLQGDDMTDISIGGAVEDIKSPNPLEEILDEEFRRHLKKAVDGLLERDRLVISLYYYEELTLKEIGEVLGVSESRVSQLHARAISRLQMELEKYMSFEEDGGE